ncbi:MAG: hypothetical protein HYV67_02240 [Candidatus Taylorbacteria bacterium]|nr:hypothetical protein [Candidatus Taylorbacteria bacterium]
MESSKKSLITGIVAIVIIVAAVLFLAIKFYPGKSPTSGTDSTNALDKQVVLKLVSSEEKLTLAEKQAVFQSLAGEKIRQYNFTEAERFQIIKALNK